MALSGSGARRYAEALLDLASGERAVPQYRRSLEQLASVFRADVVRSLRDPRTPLERRRRALDAATKEEPRAIRAVLNILLERDRIALVPGIARIHGLAGCMASELLDFGHDTFGLAFNLEEDTVSAIILGEYQQIKEGDEVRTTGRIIETPAGDELVGRVVDPLGRPLDGKGPINAKTSRRMDVVAPGVIERQNVDTPVATGIKSIDAMFPIGRGQRELIIGDRQTGKSAIAIDTIINPKGKDLICIYVAIGQKESSVAKLVATLEEHGAMEHSIVVIPGASDPATLQYIAPFAGCAMGEFFRDGGKDALVVYDDLSKHAWAYRQVSLLTR